VLVQAAETCKNDHFWALVAPGKHVLLEFSIAAAIGYAINQQRAIERFLDDGRLPLSNGISRAKAPPRSRQPQNWLFVGSEGGALADTVFVSLIAGCPMHGIEPTQHRLTLSGLRLAPLASGSAKCALRIVV
jgi:hypothetical protein